jgi:hypothetical protein
MEKINLLLSKENHCSFNNYWIVNFLRNYFNIVYLEDNVHINKSNTVVVSGAGSDNWVKSLEEQGYKIVVEHLWNSGPTEIASGSMILTNPNWFWYSESLYYQSKGYDRYIPNRKYRKLAFMPLWHSKLHKDMLFDQLTDMLDFLIYSYVERGINLPNDDIDSSLRYNFFNPSWYEDTSFSIVAETRVDSEYFFVSEKTFKPIAFYHPFIILGPPKILEFLRNNGFETFENIFDESYDTEFNLKSRVAKIVANIVNFKEVPYDSITQDKIKHNHDLFFNSVLVNERFTKEIIQPILEYFETKQ